MNKVHLNWVSQINQLIKQKCPCVYNELLFQAISLVPHAVARNSFQRRKSLAATEIRRRCVITDDVCDLRPRKQRKKGMQWIIHELKERGTIEPLQHMKIGTVKTYKNVLQRMQWISMESDERWKWIGPSDADYRDAIYAHRGPKQKDQPPQ
jgi:hypothetical protein